jgi:hypothetical protein
MRPSSPTIRKVAAKDLSLMDQLLHVFAEAFEDPAAYRSARPSPRYMRGLLGSDHCESACNVDPLTRGIGVQN